MKWRIIELRTSYHPVNSKNVTFQYIFTKKITSSQIKQMAWKSTSCNFHPNYQRQGLIETIVELALRQEQWPEQIFTGTLSLTYSLIFLVFYNTFRNWAEQCMVQDDVHLAGKRTFRTSIVICPNIRVFLVTGYTGYGWLRSGYLKVLIRLYQRVLF